MYERMLAETVTIQGYNGDFITPYCWAFKAEFLILQGVYGKIEPIPL
jgi:hypothetical protein